MAKTIRGQEFSVHTLLAEKKTESDYIFTNVMTVKGVQSTDRHGDPVKMKNGSPVISSVIKIEKGGGVPLVTYAFSSALRRGGIILAIAVLLLPFNGAEPGTASLSFNLSNT